MGNTVQDKSTNPFLQTYQATAGLSPDTPANDATKNPFSFGNILKDQIKETLEISKSAEQAITSYQNKEITQQEFIFLSNEAHLQLQSAKLTIEKAVNAIKEVSNIA